MGDGVVVYEERLVLIRANDFDQAIQKAELEAQKYASEANGREYLGHVDVYEIVEEHISDGTEVYSLMRESKLDAEEYITRFFDTGEERWRISENERES